MSSLRMVKFASCSGYHFSGRSKTLLNTYRHGSFRAIKLIISASWESCPRLNSRQLSQTALEREWLRISKHSCFPPLPYEIHLLRAIKLEQNYPLLRITQDLKLCISWRSKYPRENSSSPFQQGLVFSLSWSEA